MERAETKCPRDTAVRTALANESHTFAVTGALLETLNGRGWMDGSLTRVGGHGLCLPAAVPVSGAAIILAFGIRKKSATRSAVLRYCHHRRVVGPLIGIHVILENIRVGSLYYLTGALLWVVSLPRYRRVAILIANARDRSRRRKFPQACTECGYDLRARSSLPAAECGPHSIPLSARRQPETAPMGAMLFRVTRPVTPGRDANGTDQRPDGAERRGYEPGQSYEYDEESSTRRSGQRGRWPGRSRRDVSRKNGEARCKTVRAVRAGGTA